MPANIIESLQVKPNTEVSLYNWKSNGLKKLDKEEAERTLEQNLIKKMSELQYKLFADKSQALLIILQGLSAAGKDSYCKKCNECIQSSKLSGDIIQGSQ